MEFLTHNPQLVIFIILFIVARVMSAKKKQAQKAVSAQQTANRPSQQAANRQRQQPPQRAETTTRASANLRDVELSLLKVMEQADRDFFAGDSSSSSQSTTPSTRSVPEVVPASISSFRSASGTSSSGEDPFAFKSLLHKDDAERVGTDARRTDYDVTGVDYDTQSRGFGFRPALNETTEQEYHLTGFQKFQFAHGLSAQERSKTASESAYNEAVPLPGITFDPADLRRAIVMQEILGRPRAHR